jgi:hypothetical protein
MTDITWDEIINAIADPDVSNANASLCIVSNELPTGLLNAYDQDGISLVLGAGVSTSCGLPSWTELLLRLHAGTLANLNATDLDKLTTAYLRAVGDEGPLVSARMAQSNQSDQDFIERVRSTLYTAGATQSNLLTEIAKVTNLCEGKKGVRGIITYNYDSLLEEALKQIGRLYDRRDRRDRGSNKGVPLRHVHGFLERSATPDEWIVLSEKQYHDEYSNPYAWSNVVQLNAFRETTCLFIGLSMTDPNLRRLLEDSRKTVTPQHFAFLRRTNIADLQLNLDFRWGNRGQPPAGKKTQLSERLKLLCGLADSSRSSTLNELGVEVIWYDEHANLPTLLERLRNT